MAADAKFMKVAMALARKGIGNVEPNPAVGCVIVKNGRIIGKGCHKKFGGPHAEINALSDCRKKGNNPAGATMYVTLEPCCHFGKTPPCTNAIIKAKIAKVVIAAIDPSKHANGRGVKKLKQAGIDVEIGLCEKQAKLLNAPFFKFATTGKPWIILKWAQSKDGFLASKKHRWLSNKKSRADAQKIRRRADAILVGINTVLADDPLLTARPARRDKKLLRVVLDSQLRIPLNCNLTRTIKKAPVLVFTANKNNKKITPLRKKGAEIITVPSAEGKCNLKDVLAALAQKGIQQLLVEGGPTVITSFLRAGLADEIIVYTAPKKLGRLGTASATKPMAKAANPARLHNLDVKNLNADLRINGFFKNPLDK
jgi:diaminohydroxyphosphoribosylaminopyrimidine deaminase/5-amino-6-(5-phosphoribosylamino)uracil reductase